MHDPRQPHLDAVYMILRYLKAAPEKGVMFTNNKHLGVESYTYADWAGCLHDRRSTSGYYTSVGGNLVTWRSKKQPVVALVALSSAEAEYRAMARGVHELLWIRLFLTEVGLRSDTPMKLHCDNKSDIAIAHDPVQHDRTKHIEIDRHFIKENINNNVISIQFGLVVATAVVATSAAGGGGGEGGGESAPEVRW
ncbi:secreted RxLR effector protein 161-like [Apium graveolens]|uniref:secreted RxLR effector protein 161-like n=1 Tax=Apium graveolens TaxID=4045 RepID=UPI003D7A6AB4